MTPKPIHATFAISLFLVQCSRTRLLSDAGALVRRDPPLSFPPLDGCYATRQLLARSLLAGGYWGVAPVCTPVCTEVLALSELEGTPMMAAPSRAAAAVTASRAVFTFTANLHQPPIARG